MNTHQRARLLEILKSRGLENWNIRHVEGFVRLKTLFLGTLTDKEWDNAVEDALHEMERYTPEQREEIATKLGVPLDK
jgi:hypothetical protein